MDGLVQETASVMVYTCARGIGKRSLSLEKKDHIYLIGMKVEELLLLRDLHLHDLL